MMASLFMEAALAEINLSRKATIFLLNFLLKLQDALDFQHARGAIRAADIRRALDYARPVCRFIEA